MNSVEINNWINQTREPMVIKKWEAVNRSQRRSMDSEIKKVGFELLGVEKRFLENLFDESLSESLEYKDFYNYFLEQWKRNVSIIKKLYNPKWCVINEHYFEKTYKPIV